MKKTLSAGIGNRRFLRKAVVLPPPSPSVLPQPAATVSRNRIFRPSAVYELPDGLLAPAGRAAEAQFSGSWRALQKCASLLQILLKK